jgi:Protein of unknown function, DUF488
MQLYTMGYSGYKPEVLHAEVLQRSALLADIRYNAFSRYTPWSGKALQQALGPHYVHMPQLGNKNYKSEGIVLADYSAGLDIIRVQLQRWQAIILLCACAELSACHRLTVADKLGSDLAVPIEHLSKHALYATPMLFPC